MDHFLPFYSLPPKTPKNQNLKKTKIIAGDIIVLHMCTENHNHIRYGFWDREQGRQNALSFCAIFFPFTPITTWKTKILKKWKQHLEMSSFHTCAPNGFKISTVSFHTMRTHLPFDPPNKLKNQGFEKIKKTPRDIIILSLCTTSHDHMINDSWDMEHKWQFFVIFALWPYQQPEKSKIWKNKIKTWKYYHFTLVYHNNHMKYGSWDMECDRQNFYHLTYVYHK